MLRVALVVGALLAAGVSHPASAQAWTAEQYERGFNEASRCFVVLRFAKEDREDHGDRDRAGFYDAKAREAFNAAMAAGRLGGRSSGQLEADIRKVTDGELPKLVGDVEYFKAAAARCKAIGYL